MVSNFLWYQRRIQIHDSVAGSFSIVGCFYGSFFQFMIGFISLTEVINIFSLGYLGNKNKNCTLPSWKVCKGDVLSTIV